MTLCVKSALKRTPKIALKGHRSSETEAYKEWKTESWVPMTATSTEKDEATNKESSPEKILATPRGIMIKREVATKCISLAIKKYKEVLNCTSCGEQNNVFKRWTGSADIQILKCKICSKCISENTVPEMMAKRVVENWRDQVGRMQDTHRKGKLTESKDDVVMDTKGKTSENGTTPRNQLEDLQEAVQHAIKQNRTLLNENRKQQEEIQDALNRIENLERLKSTDRGSAKSSQETTVHGIKLGTPDWEKESQNGPANIVQENKDKIAQTGSTREQDNEDDTPSDKLDWAKNAKLYRPSNGISSTTILQKIRNSRKLNDRQHTRVRPEPRTTDVYFKDVRRGPIGILPLELSECLPRWAILNLSFVVGSRVEVITDVKLKDWLTANLKIVGIAEVQDFDIVKAANTRQIGDDRVNATD